MFWKKLTTRGAVYGGSLGLFTAIVLVILSKAVWVDVLGNKTAIYAYENPALFSMSVAFIGIWIISLMDNSESAAKEIAAFDHQYIRSQTGIGAEGSSGH